MGKLRFLLLACGAALLWAVSPALSVTPYTPGAEDFSQPMPAVTKLDVDAAGERAAAGAHADEGPVKFISPVIEAPARFDLVGIARELEPLEYRARLEGDAWSDWIETANGDPVYFGGADEVQVRSRGVRPEGELFYVNVSGTSTPADRILTALRETVNSAFISATSVAVAEAKAQPPQPAVLPRAEWGANQSNGGCPPRTGPSYGEVKAGIVHHTVSANDYTPSEAPGIVLGICRFHRNGNGWNDIGYNFLVDRFGTVYEGRSGGIAAPVVGAHTAGFNSQTFGAASIGTHTAFGITPEAKQSFVDLIAWKLALHGTIAAGKSRLISGGGESSKFPKGKKVNVKRVSGHRRLGETACPGNALKHQIKEIRRQAQEKIEGHPPPAPGGVGP
jgi:N-acetylmuramoyl-L-alanine amidase